MQSKLITRDQARSSILTICGNLVLVSVIGLGLKLINPDGAIINIDLIAIQGFYFIRSSYRAALFTLILVIMTVDAIANRFMFDLIPFLQQIHNLSADLIIANVATVSICLFGALILGLAASKIKPMRVPSTAILISIVALADACQGSLSILRFSNRSFGLGRVDIAYSELNRIRVQLHSAARPLRAHDLKPAISASQLLLSSSAKYKILIVVESLGVTKKDFALVDWGYGHVFRRHPKLVIKKRGTVAAFGGTVSGELRELCQLEVHAAGVLDSYENCIPKKFEKQSYITVAAHSYRGSMFDRKIWWPEAGFKNVIFKDDRIEAYRECPRTLNSLCDAPMLEGELRSALGRQKTFFYFLTSNSHLPAPVGLSVERMLTEALDGVLTAVDNATRGVKGADIDIIVVGDHPPPIMGFAAQAYVSGKVPFWLLATHK